MIYDRDLKLLRWILRLLTAANLGSAFLNARAHHWLIAAACLIWTGNTLVQLSIMRSQQLDRDGRRDLLSAAVKLADDIASGANGAKKKKT